MDDGGDGIYLPPDWAAASAGVLSGISLVGVGSS